MVTEIRREVVGLRPIAGRDVFASRDLVATRDDFRPGGDGQARDRDVLG
jgi:hypothetical protein